MQFLGFQSFCTLSFLFVALSAAHAHDNRRPYQARDIFSPLASLADSILGITTTQSADETTAAASATTSQITSAQDDSTTTAAPQIVTVVPTVAAPTSSIQISSSSETNFSTTTSSSTTIPTASLLTSSSASPTTSRSTAQSPPPPSSSSQPTPATPANPIQGLSSSSSGTQKAKQDSGNSVPAAGVAVAVVFGALILAGVAYLLYRYHRSAKANLMTATTTQKPSKYNELKRSSCYYFDHDEEQGILHHNPGLGLGKVANLKPAPPDKAAATTPHNKAHPYRTRSRAGSDDTLVSSQPTTLPVSPLDNRREAPLPPLPRAAQESWPIISPVDAPYPPSLMATRPATAATTIAKVGSRYTPYRPAAQPVIGLAVPLGNSRPYSPESLCRPRPMSRQTREVVAFEKAKRLSGVHELS